ncbi:PIG-L family deacetylase [Nocardioides hankookensis]|uniref:PIG-L deacetylase family protein n=1 Tax=Nocardioides hankookensis TaxID=443157 RepID=A0ABW1LMS4_9ACTN
MTGARFTVVSFHAHPDDEALLTGGTLARAAAEGHRVVLVVATAGEAGLASPLELADLAERRTRELAASAAALGIARVEVLGYRDSRFAEVDLDEAANRVADILRAERADVLTTYDAAGGYGHPDHVQVHRVGRRAAELAGTPVVLEATLDRGLIDRVVRTLRHLSRVVPVPELPDTSRAFTARADLTHEVDVRAHLDAKLAALRAHASQAGGGPRTLALLLRLPKPLARRVLGREWFREVGRRPGEHLDDDIFASLRRSGAWQVPGATLAP